MESFFSFIGSVVEFAIIGLVWICVMLILSGMRDSGRRSKNSRY